jgi:uncharacterized membrane protein YGL010W
MLSPMSPLLRNLSAYATYHRDPRNIATHFFGIPMIVLGVAVMLSRPAITTAGFAVSPLWLVMLGSLLWLLRLDLRYGLVMTALFGGAAYFGAWAAAQSTALWLGIGLGLFVAGWAIQFVGHLFEGKKPAFLDDLRGLLVGPLFIVAEAGFALGLRKEVLKQIEAVAGPTRLNPNARPGTALPSAD